jgi:hypothetical protein
MSEHLGCIACRFKLEEAKFFYQQMELFLADFENEQARERFHYCLDAFLSAARSVTLAFQKEFKRDAKLKELYELKAEGWKGNKIMEFFKGMRNISLHECTPQTITLLKHKGRLNLRKTTARISSNGKIERIAVPISREISKGMNVVVFFYNPLPEWLNSNPDVMVLGGQYLEELGEFVTEVENMIEKE